jgi:uncharacterized protein (DUF4415 family)
VRFVLDTNVVLSGLLWTGSPMRLLAAAQAGEAELFTSRALLAELHRCLARGHFRQPLKQRRPRHSHAYSVPRSTPMKPEYDFSRARRGPIAAPAPGKTRITIRLDEAILEWFRKRVHAAGGGSYQALINQALQQHIAREDDVLADTLPLERYTEKRIREFDRAEADLGKTLRREKRAPSPRES